MRLASWWVALPLAAAAAVAAPRDASACGGCIGEVTTVVTDHRMILSVAKDQSTLYDQIEYSGNPAAFAWVLPISGTVDVGLSSDVLFQSLDTLTTTRVLPPPRNCPAPDPSCPVSLEAGAKKSASPEEDVTVNKREVVGPYETVQLSSTNANALEGWLGQNGFVVPADVKPVIAQYVAEKFDFLALKLVPGQGVHDMRPVRVTTKGASSVLPLRMVAAGTGATVGVTLWVVGEGRYEPQNFPTFFIGGDELVWDWPTNKSNYVALRAEKSAAAGGRGWELESSTTQGSSPIQSRLQYAGEESYLPAKDAQGVVVKTAAQVRDEDFATLFRGAPTARVTRFRSDLAHAALNADLVMVASLDQAEVSSQRQTTKEAAEPLCNVYDGCTVVAMASRSQAAARSSGAGAGSSSSSSCATGAGGASSGFGALGAFAGFVAFSIGRARARRRRRAEVLEKR